MSIRSPKRPLGAFLKALKKEKIDFILIGMMAAIEQGVPMGTMDYDFWVDLPERQYVRFLTIIQSQNGIVRAPTLYELADGTQVNIVFQPTGLRSFQYEYKRCKLGRFQGESVRVLPLHRIIANKKAANRDKDKIALPALMRCLKLGRRLK